MLVPTVQMLMVVLELAAYRASAAANLARRKEVIIIDTGTVVALVLGTASLVVAIIGLVVKIIELTRH